MLPFIILIFGTLVLAATFSQGTNFTYIIATFFLQVQVYGCIMELVLACLLFKDRYYCAIRIVLPCKTFQVLTIGRLFCERIICENLQEKCGFNVYNYRYLLGCIQIDTISADTTMCDSSITINDVEMVDSNPMHVDKPRYSAPLPYHSFIHSLTHSLDHVNNSGMCECRTALHTTIKRMLKALNPI